MKITTQRERDCILAALILWQARNLPDSAATRLNAEMAEGTSRRHGPPLSTTEVHALMSRVDDWARTPDMDPSHPGLVRRLLTFCKNFLEGR